MARTLYSTRFANVAATGDGNFHVIYTVPAGVVAIIRDLDLFAQTAALAFGLRLAGNVIVSFVNPTAAGTAYQWTGRQVLLPGETLEYFASNGLSFTACISGYLLNV